TQSITGVGFQPDWLWIKNRDGTNNHILQDAVRGATKSLESDGTGAETTSSTRVTSFDSDGFSIGSAGTNNTNTNNYVSWNWKANGSGSANSDGSINSTVSVNTTSGFSIVQYTGTGSAATVGHGLGVTPNVMLAKRLNSTGQWDMYHSGLSNPKSGSMVLNDTAAFTGDTSIWNNTDPTSSLVNIGTSSTTNASGGTYVMYCFADVQGFSKFGSYIGNGNANGSFIYTAFKPAFVIVKRTDNTGHWIMKDWQTPGYNQNDYYLWSDASDAETSASSLGIDFLSNGFKIKGTAGNSNADGGTFIYMAFGQPIVSTNGDIATAR
ncbi:MAG: hypothetical protein CBD88_08125, partial [Flavobacteriales bacterium TMED228]